MVLAGRAQLCVNDAVRALASAPRMNDRCAELQRAGSKRASSKPKGAKRGAGADGATSTGCPFLRKRRGAVAALKELVLAEPLEVRPSSAYPFSAPLRLIRALTRAFAGRGAGSRGPRAGRVRILRRALGAACSAPRAAAVRIAAAARDAVRNASC